MDIDKTLNQVTEQQIDELLADKIIESGILEEGNVNGWIKVEDKLPIDEDLFLCFGIDGITIRGYNPDYECWDTEDQDDFFCKAIGGRITHWQPVAEPPS